MPRRKTKSSLRLTVNSPTLVIVIADADVVDAAEEDAAEIVEIVEDLAVVVVAVKDAVVDAVEGMVLKTWTFPMKALSPLLVAPTREKNHSALSHALNEKIER